MSTEWYFRCTRIIPSASTWPKASHTRSGGRCPYPRPRISLFFGIWGVESVRGLLRAPVNLGAFDAQRAALLVARSDPTNDLALFHSRICHMKNLSHSPLRACRMESLGILDAVKQTWLLLPQHYHTLPPPGIALAAAICVVRWRCSRLTLHLSSVTSLYGHRRSRVRLIDRESVNPSATVMDVWNTPFVHPLSDYGSENCALPSSLV